MHDGDKQQAKGNHEAHTTYAIRVSSSLAVDLFRVLLLGGGSGKVVVEKVVVPVHPAIWSPSQTSGVSHAEGESHSPGFQPRQHGN